MVTREAAHVCSAGFRLNIWSKTPSAATDTPHIINHPLGDIETIPTSTRKTPKKVVTEFIKKESNNAVHIDPQLITRRIAASSKAMTMNASIAKLRTWTRTEMIPLKYSNKSIPLSLLMCVSHSAHISVLDLPEQEE